MSRDVTNQHYTRREIRKINREAQIEHLKPRQIVLRVVLLICAIIFATCEVFGIMRAKRVHDQELAKEFANETIIELGVINASLFSSNRALLGESHRRYQIILARLNDNSYMQNSQSNLLSRLNEYDQILTEEEKSAHLVKLRTAIVMLQKELQDAETEKVSAETMIGLKENFEDFRSSLEELDNNRFAPFMAELIKYSNELIDLIDKTSVCVGACTEKSFKSRYDELERVFPKYQATLADYDAHLSSYYSPAELVEALEMLQ